jgi:hypothetical protein
VIEVTFILPKRMFSLEREREIFKLLTMQKRRK